MGFIALQTCHNSLGPFSISQLWTSKPCVRLHSNSDQSILCITSYTMILALPRTANVHQWHQNTSKPLGLSARRSHTIILSMFYNNFDGTSRAVLWLALTARWSLDGSPSQGHNQYARSHNMHEFNLITLKNSFLACQRSSRPSQGRQSWCCCHCCCCCALTCHFSHAHATVALQQQLENATKNFITFWGLEYAKAPRMLLGTCCDRWHLVIRNTCTYSCDVLAQWFLYLGFLFRIDLPLPMSSILVYNVVIN
jgi:hypothetical protein